MTIPQIATFSIDPSTNFLSSRSDSTASRSIPTAPREPAERKFPLFANFSFATLGNS